VFGSVPVYMNIGVIYLEIIYDETNKIHNIIIHIITINTTPICLDLLWVTFRECTLIICYFNTFLEDL
jgi:hypothetical protein